jgi:integrase
MKLTAQEIARYQPPAGKDHIVFDSELAGFGLRYRNGRRTWVYQYAFGTGASRVNSRITLGEYPAIPPAKARETAQDLYARVRLGQHPAADKRANRDEARNTFGKLVGRYIEFQKDQVRIRSHIEIKRYLDDYAKPLHNLPASAVDRKRIADFLDTVADKNGPIASNRARSALSAMFSWAMKKGLHDANPTIATEKRREKSRHRVLTDNEVALVWNALGNDNFAEIVRLLILTGQRAGEIGSLRWSEIDFENALISLPPERTKNGHPHQIPMSAAVAGILESRTKTRDFVFGRGVAGFAAWGRAKKRLDAKTGDSISEPWTVHDLRRTLATGLQRLGVRFEVTEAVLNHTGGSRSGIAGVYQRHNWTEEKRSALDAWAAHVLAVVSGKKGKNNVTTIRRGA